MSSTFFALRARYVFPVNGPPLANGVVAIRDGRIAWVGDFRALEAGVACTNLGQVALLPGLVNAHTHLEFSDLSAPVGGAGQALPDWIRSVIAERQVQVDAQRSRAAVERGLMESLAAGTTLLGEIAQPSWNMESFDDSPLGASVFLEFIGLTEARLEGWQARAAEHLEQRAKRTNWWPGLSPHAPYTVHERLLRGLVELAAGRGAMVAMHLAESPEELELLRTGNGAFLDLLCERGVWQPEAILRDARPMDYLRRLDGAPRVLVVHGNYLDDAEIAWLAERAARMAVVYCPRTHAYFGHAAYPLGKMIQSGVRLAVGTDSRASNPDLSLLAELRFIASKFGNVSPERVLRMGTQDGALALGWDDVGTLEVGQRANLAVVALPVDDRRGPYELLFDSTEPVVGTMIEGRWYYKSEAFTGGSS